MAPMAEADCCSGRRRFAVACSVLSRCVRAEAAAAGRVAAAAAPHGRSEAEAQAASSTMLLMPGADVDAREEAAAAPAPAQLTIMYGGRVLVFDDVPAGWAAEVMRAAARQDVPDGPDDLQVARKASLQRLMQKRRDRTAARVPYAAPARPVVLVAPKEGQEEGDAGSWLGLGIPRGCAC
ncbi:hypothetical protein SETIT_9G252200v2 [Setaria italica]|uniref:Protein TIFY n=2 Tax=Setaria italica TaxID=4555 RepID=A0A368SKC1_SETIT|nr:protein TIFY 11f [Setaria italica]RCV42896.1 hypothetical protein SETIT_9G252200v2 [Setaria italica]